MSSPRKADIEHTLRRAASLIRRRLANPSALIRSGRSAADILKNHGLRGLAAALRAGHDEPTSEEDYRDWIARNEPASRRGIAAVRRRIAKLRRRPLISILLPVHDTPERLLHAAIGSILDQIYETWELCIADNASSAPHVSKMLQDYAARDPRIKITRRDTRGEVAEATNAAAASASGEWIAAMEPDALLSPYALAELAFEIDRHPDAELIYSDEDRIDETGSRRFGPHFKPDFSRELFRSHNYLGHLAVHRTANIRAVGGWRTGFEGSQDYDLNLRIYERIDAAKIRHVAKVLYHARTPPDSTAADAGLRALEQHVARTGLRARVEPAPRGAYYRLRLEIPEPRPLVSLIVPTRDRLDLLRRCIDSVTERTTYDPYEIIVIDNGSVETETLAYLASLAARPRLRVLRDDRPFNYSALCNNGAAHAAGAIIGLINNDIEVISPDWLDEMVSWAVDPAVGCVGAKLYYPNDTIQHAGVVLRIADVATHAHINQPRSTLGDFGRAVVVGNYSAVTGACLVVRTSVFGEVGGFDENLPVALNDVDFCLRVRAAGYSNVWTPHAELYHHESLSRGKDASPEQRNRLLREVRYMRKTWRAVIEHDPFYTPGLVAQRLAVTACDATQRLPESPYPQP